MDSRSPSPDFLSKADELNQNEPHINDYSDDDNLKIIGMEVTALIGNNGNMFRDLSISENGNISQDLETLRIMNSSERRSNVESTEECPNDSFTDEEGEVNHYNYLRRKR